eukprot:1522437-Prymnesium_polylepis.2
MASAAKLRCKRTKSIVMLTASGICNPRTHSESNAEAPSRQSASKSRAAVSSPAASAELASCAARARRRTNR